MKALVCDGPVKKTLEDRAKPPGSRRCDRQGNDDHDLWHGSAHPGRLLGHEGVSLVDSAGTSVTAFHRDDRCYSKSEDGQAPEQVQALTAERGVDRAIWTTVVPRPTPESR